MLKVYYNYIYFFLIKDKLFFDKQNLNFNRLSNVIQCAISTITPYSPICARAIRLTTNMEKIININK